MNIYDIVTSSDFNKFEMVPLQPVPVPKPYVRGDSSQAQLFDLSHSLSQ